jgi:3-methyladenine DNA glycosylase AlkC
MAEPLKYMYNPEFFERLCPTLRKTIPTFDCQHFIRLIFNNQWPDLELKQRVRHISNCLRHFLPEHFPDAIKDLVRLSKNLLADGNREQGFQIIFIADYIEVNGVDFPNESLAAMESVTQLVSCEFAIRPFLIRYPEMTMSQMLKWSKHSHASVRRLSSEGCRPRLPWAMGVPHLKKDVSQILPILHHLKADESEYVRRSVANNLNDIAKDHPQIVLDLIRKWKTNDPNTSWIIRHGCRTLLKKGNNDVLNFHGFDPKSKSSIPSLNLPKAKVKIGDVLNFNFHFVNREKKPTAFRLEYAIDYLTSSGKISRKVFKITENKFDPGKKIEIKRKQSFKNFTTRKHYKGKHQITILANGKKLAAKEFLVW